MERERYLSTDRYKHIHTYICVSVYVYTYINLEDNLKGEPNGPKTGKSEL